MPINILEILFDFYYYFTICRLSYLTSTHQILQYDLETSHILLSI